MIIGIGSDITDIRRIEKVIERHGERFLSRIFTDTERARAERRAGMTRRLIRRFERALSPKPCVAEGVRLDLRFGGLQRRAADDLAHLAGLLGERAHLRLHIGRVKPQHFADVLGVQQRLRIVE